MDLCVWISLLFSLLLLVKLGSRDTTAGARSIHDVIATASHDVTTHFASVQLDEEARNTHENDEKQSGSDVDDKRRDQTPFHGQFNTDGTLSGLTLHLQGNSSNSTAKYDDVIDVTSPLTFAGNVTRQEVTDGSDEKLQEKDERNDRILTIKNTSHAVLIMLLSVVVILAIIFTLFGLFTKAEAHTKDSTSYRNGLLCDNREGPFALQATSLFHDDVDL